MCFFVQLKNYKPQIAKEDIICFKSGYIKIKPSVFTKTKSKVFESGLQKYIYGIGYKQPKINLKKKLAFNRNGVFDISIVIDKGYHSYSSKNIPDIVNAIFIIPKGTQYYYNDIYKHYISETIILKKII